MKVKRMKILEYGWIFKAAFYVNAYTIKHTNGKIYIVYAHDFNDMEWFLTKLDLLGKGLATYQKDCWVKVWQPIKRIVLIDLKPGI